MYKTRDIEVRIPVHPGACSIYESKSRGNMCEILVPPEDISGFSDFTSWGSIMVEMEQVRTLNDDINIVYVNDGAEIISSVKDEKHVPISEETLLPNAIIGRWLKWYRWYRFTGKNILSEQALNIPSIHLFNDFVWSRMNITDYVNRLPMHL